MSKRKVFYCYLIDQMSYLVNPIDVGIPSNHFDILCQLSILFISLFIVVYFSNLIVVSVTFVKHLLLKIIKIEQCVNNI